MNNQRKVAKEFDSYHNSYANTVNKALSFTGLDVDYFTVVKADYMIDLINDYYGTSEVIKGLDIGCGIGSFHFLLTQRINQLTGIDVSTESIAQAKKNNHGVSYDIYEGNTLPYADNTFDVVFTICVLHHVPPEQWSNFVNEMNRVLKPGGLALIFEHNPKNILTRRVVANCPFDKDALLLKGKETVNLLSSRDFSSIELNYILTIPVKGRALRQVDRWFSKVPFGAQYYVSAIKST